MRTIIWGVVSRFQILIFCLNFWSDSFLNRMNFWNFEIRNMKFNSYITQRYRNGIDFCRFLLRLCLCEFWKNTILNAKLSNHCVRFIVCFCFFPNWLHFHFIYVKRSKEKKFHGNFHFVQFVHNMFRIKLLSFGLNWIQKKKCKLFLLLLLLYM